MLIHTNLVKEEDKGPGKGLCLICEYGFQEEVDKSALRGVVKKRILSVIKRKAKKCNLSEVFVPSIKDIAFHLNRCSQIPYQERTIARKARTALKMQKKTISEVNEMVMEHIAQSLSLSGSLKQEELDALSPKEKMQFATEATKLLQTEKRIALEAKKTGMEEAKFLQGIGKLASGAVAIDESEKEPILELKAE